MLYPKNQIEFEQSFSTDEQCLEYLYKLKFEDGFICKKCDNKEYWVNLRGVFVCKKCRQETSITSDTIKQAIQRKPIYNLKKHKD